jgi:hypothetical protein
VLHKLLQFFIAKLSKFDLISVTNDYYRHKYVLHVQNIIIIGRFKRFMLDYLKLLFYFKFNEVFLH